MAALFGLTNDGIEQGVGLYVDGVFYARPAAALDFLDVERIEVLRGPQGTLFGKNTTAGAINVTTRKPTFTTESDLQIDYGSFGFVQAKDRSRGPLDKVAGRISFSGTDRGGVVTNTRTGREVNDLSNRASGVSPHRADRSRGDQLSADHTRQRPEGYTQVVAGVAPALRAANRQYPQIAADLGYTAPSFNAFDRVTDVDTPLRSYRISAAPRQHRLEAARRLRRRRRGALGLESVERSRFHRAADHDHLGGPVEAAPVDAGSALRRRSLLARQPRRGRVRVQADDDSDPSFKQEQGSAAARSSSRRRRRR